MVFAYIRVSKLEQNVERQIESIKKYRPNILERNIFTDKKSGKNFERKEYKALKKYLKAGDEVIIHELDRLGRNKDEVKRELVWFQENKILIRFLNIPTTLTELADNQSWVLDMVNNILIEVYCSVAENEREVIIKRTKEGLSAAKARGMKLGRPPFSNMKIELIESMHANGASVVEIAEAVSVSKSTVYNVIKKKRCSS